MGRGPIGAPAIIRYVNNSVSEVDSVSGVADDMVLIKTLTASSSATLDFVDGTSDVVLDSTYPVYLFKFINIHPSNNLVDFQLNFRDGDSSFDATKTTTAFRAYHNEGGTDTTFGYVTGFDVAQGTGVHTLANNMGNGNDESLSGELWLFNPSSTTYVKHFMADLNNYNQDDYSVRHFSAGYCNVTAAIDGVEVKCSAGNIDSGTIKLYGIKDA
jgi:hypothetical protein|tara:strand:+ start:957 stop:1598 length:642 start_codon:yes stop_codon:yes gene_type:complete